MTTASATTSSPLQTAYRTGFTHSPFEYFTSSIGIFQEMGFPDEKIVGGVPFYDYGFPGEGNEGAYSMTYAEPELSLLGRIHSLLKAQ